MERDDRRHLLRLDPSLRRVRQDGPLQDEEGGPDEPRLQEIEDLKEFQGEQQDPEEDDPVDW